MRIPTLVVIIILSLSGFNYFTIIPCICRTDSGDVIPLIRSNGVPVSILTDCPAFGLAEHLLITFLNKDLTTGRTNAILTCLCDLINSISVFHIHSCYTKDNIKGYSITIFYSVIRHTFTPINGRTALQQERSDLTLP